MRNNEPEVMRELRKIKEEIAAELIGLPSAEVARKISEEAEAFKKEVGLKLPMRVKVWK